MKSVTHNEDRFPLLRFHDIRYRPNAVMRGHTGLFGNDVGFIDAMVREVLRAHLGFREIWIAAIAAGSDDCPGVAVLVKLKCVIQPRLEYFRWSSVVLRSTEDDNRFRDMRLIARRQEANLLVKVNPVQSDRHQNKNSQQ